MASRPGEDPHDVGPAADLLVEAFLGVVGPDLAPDLAGEGGEGQQVLAGLIQVRGGCGELGFQSAHDLDVLGADGGGVGLLEDGADQGGHPRLGRFGHLGGQIPRVVDVMPTSA